MPEKPACEFQYESWPVRTFTVDGSQPRMSATTCEATVSWPWPCGVVPSVTTISPKMSSFTVATSLLPENCSSELISRDWPKLFVPESSVEPIPSAEQPAAALGVAAALVDVVPTSSSARSSMPA